MKILISALALFSVSALAAESTDICERFMTCGTYVHDRDPNDDESVETKIVISSTGPMKGKFDYILTNKDGKSHVWPLEATFKEDGSGVLLWKGEDVYAVTVCGLKMCNYALVPFESKELGIWGNAGLMRFTGGTLEFMMTVGTPTNYRSRGYVLQKR